MARLTYEQIYPILNEIYAQQTGRSAQAAVDFASMTQLFTSDTAISQDNLYGVLDTVIQKTIFAVRPYSRKLKGMEWSSEQYGDITRKLTPVNVDDIENSEWSIPEEMAKQAPDFSCCSAPVLQDFLSLAIAGGNTYARKWTIYRNQMNAAFHNEAEVSSFFSMLMTERQNRHEKDFDYEKMSLLNNVIIGLSAIGGQQVFNARTAYNQASGETLSAQDIMNPENFRPFMIWLMSEIDYIRNVFADMTDIYHVQVTGKEVTRHTSRGNQRLYIHSKFAAFFRNNKSMLYSPDNLDGWGDYSEISYWQSPTAPFTVIGKGTYTGTDGSRTVTENTTVSNVIGLLTDKDMFGISNISMWSAPEPYNAKFGFQNTWYHDTFRSLCDFTENAVLITLN